MSRHKPLLYCVILFTWALYSAVIIVPPGHAEGSPLGVCDFYNGISSLEDQAVEQSGGRLWHLSRISAFQAWQTTTGSEEIRIAVLDTGINDTHPVLSGKVADEINFSDSPEVSDRHGHGTHVAGIIAGGVNELGQAIGIAYTCTLMNVKVANDDGTVDPENVAEGIRWAVNNGADIINVSLTIYSDCEALETAVDYAWEQGALVIAAAGNTYTGWHAYPAMYESTIAVAATDTQNRIAAWSNRGEWVDVSAPGASIFSSVLENGFAYKTGTSMAAALVSGEAALLFSIATDTSGNGSINDEVRDAIRESCLQIEEDEMENRIINVFKAVETLVPAAGK